MKRVLSVLLTLLMVVPLLSGCGSATPETPEEGSSSYHEDITTEPPPATEEDPFEGADPLPADLVIPDAVKLEDGTALGTIVLPAGADQVLTFAAQELQTHIRLVTGAETPIVSRTGEGYGSLVLVTPESLPLVAERFSDDIAWLSDLGSKETGRFGSDGFSIRLADSRVYVIGNTSRGTLNGVYDWIEENLGVLWIRADESYGTLYDPMPEVTAKVADYREKSPFEYRGWNLIGMPWYMDYPYPEVMLSRNKLNTECSPYDTARLDSIGVRLFPFTHNIKNLVLTSPLYDPNNTEYWDTDSKGVRNGPDTSVQINWWSEDAVQAVAASLIEQAKQSAYRYVFIGEEDSKAGVVRPEDTEPFEYAPGQFIAPEEDNYLSTVVMTFYNRVARIIKEELPDVKLGVFAYKVMLKTPACAPDDNVLIVFAPLDEDMATPLCSYDIKTKKGITTKVRSYCDYIRSWSELATDVDIYNYYGCCRAAAYYERPIWDRIQQDFRDYVTLGITGVTSEGTTDFNAYDAWVPEPVGCIRFWDMNALTYWLYSRLAWNPDEDVNALIHLFCEKAYKDAAPMMEHYYELLKYGWDRGNARTDWSMDIHHFWDWDFYYEYYVKFPRIASEMKATLEAAWEAADESVRTRLAYLKETVITYLHPIIDDGFGEPLTEEG
ncbi:MAG: DUF4838 domain-containing protein [Clostridia bacterium]|nr:DUF4838 domain-containing protein [Clostridia bacterium]